jgi:hypothetical protein
VLGDGVVFGGAVVGFGSDICTNSSIFVVTLFIFVIYLFDIYPDK